MGCYSAENLDRLKGIMLSEISKTEKDKYCEGCFLHIEFKDKQNN